MVLGRTGSEVVGSMSRSSKEARGFSWGTKWGLQGGKVRRARLCVKFCLWHAYNTSCR